MSETKIRAAVLPPTPPGRPRLAPRCEQEVAEMTARFRVHCGRDIQCERRARYEIDGRKLCKTHAGDAVLAILTGKPQ